MGVRSLALVTDDLIQELAVGFAGGSSLCH
jgi:hypothetical protein